MPHTISMVELARRYWRLAGRHKLSLPVIQRAARPLDERDQPLQVEGDETVELPLALARVAVEEGVPVMDVLHAFADGLDPPPVRRA